eukprot:CFRG1508T1
MVDVSYNEGCFKKVNVTEYVHLPPQYIGNPEQGVRDILNEKLLRYNEELGGVVLCYEGLRAKQSSARTIADSPFCHFDVNTSLLLFAPVVGTEMVGTVHKVGVDHVGVLVFGTFNVSIPKEFIHRDLMFNKDEFVWYDPGNDAGVKFSEGSLIRFQIQSWETKSDVFYIIGALPEDKTRIIPVDFDCENTDTLESAVTIEGERTEVKHVQEEEALVKAKKSKKEKKKSKKREVDGEMKDEHKSKKSKKVKKSHKH